MIKLDQDTLQRLELGQLPPLASNVVLRQIYLTLEKRVGIRLASQMTNEQLDDFEGFIKAKDEAGALKWLEERFPTYRTTVSEALDELYEEILQSRTEVLAVLQDTKNVQAMERFFGEGSAVRDDANEASTE